MSTSNIERKSLTIQGFRHWLKQQGKTLCAGQCPLSHFTGEHVGYTDRGIGPTRMPLPPWAMRFVRQVDFVQQIEWSKRNYPVSDVLQALDEAAK